MAAGRGSGRGPGRQLAPGAARCYATLLLRTIAGRPGAPYRRQPPRSLSAPTWRKIRHPVDALHDSHLLGLAWHYYDERSAVERVAGWPAGTGLTTRSPGKRTLAAALLIKHPAAAPPDRTLPAALSELAPLAQGSTAASAIHRAVAPCGRLSADSQCAATRAADRLVTRRVDSVRYPALPDCALVLWPRTARLLPWPALAPVRWLPTPTSWSAATCRAPSTPACVERAAASTPQGTAPASPRSHRRKRTRPAPARPSARADPTRWSAPRPAPGTSGGWPSTPRT